MAPRASRSRRTPSPTVDQDGDGYPSTVDCSDVNNTVHPGAPEIPGNGIDDDCTGGDQPGKVLAIVKSDAPAGAQVDVLCKGRGCPFKHGANPSGRSMCVPLGSNTPQRRC